MVNINQTETLHQIKTQISFSQPKLEDHAKTELELNKKRLQEIRLSMQNMKHEIDQCHSVLLKELGDEVDIPAMVRTGCGPGNHKRIQEIITLRLKLTAMKAKFLEPSHKMYYRGPFDPKKSFDLKMLPQKHENLYAEIMERDKLELLEHDKPQEKLKDMLKDLRLMFKASVFRTDDLNANLTMTSEALRLKKLEAGDNSRVIEYMISHQNLLKMMINPETFKLESDSVRLRNDLPSPNGKSNFYKFKTLFEKSEKENNSFIGKIYSLVERMDVNNRLLVDAERMCVNNRLQFEVLSNPGGGSGKKGKTKKRGNKDEENYSQLVYLSAENKRLIDFLESTALSYEEDFNLFVITINTLTAAFMKSFDDLKIASFEQK